MVAVAVSALFFWLNSFYYAAGKIGSWTKAYVLYTAFAIGLGCVCIERWGFLWLAGVVAAGKVLFTLLMVVFLVKSQSIFNEHFCYPPES